jgi:formylglycine-generating enzyme required for sulfatase activity/serine/threonine protein kinase
MATPMTTPTIYHHALPAGTRIEEFELKSVLGAGGFGVTYRGFDHQFHREVAIKEFLPSEIAMRRPNGATVTPRSDDDRENYQFGLNRFLEEARLLAKFDDPNIVRVHRYLEANGTAYLVMEYREGESLAQLLSRRRAPLEEDEVRRILFEVLSGLQTVHAHNYLHRDIKPSNIYLRRGGACMLIDFGAARYALGEHSRSLMGMMTPGYAPYEQYSFTSKQGPFTDIYAVGATVYRCLTLRAPVEAAERIAAATENREDPYVPAMQAAAGRYSDALLAVVDWMLQLRASDRPQTVSEVLDVLGEKPTLPRSRRPVPIAPLEDTVQLPLTVASGTVPVVAVQPGEPGWIGNWLRREWARLAQQLLGGPRMRALRAQLDERWRRQYAATTQAILEGARVVAAKWQRYETSPRARALTWMAGLLFALLLLSYRATPWHQPSQVLPVQARASGAGSAVPELVTIPAGTALIGNPAVDDKDDDLYPQTLRIARPFAMGRHEVTFEEYDRFCEATGRAKPADGGWGRGNRPVINVSWRDATAYAAWLSAETGRRFRLPSEAEWEYAARGGRRTHYWWGNAAGSGQANCKSCGSNWDGRQTAPAGSFAANPFGLHDTAGNVAEWTCTVAAGDRVPLAAPCAEPANPRRRSVRGGSWNSPPWALASWVRASEKPDTRSPEIGFRLLEELPADQ